MQQRWATTWVITCPHRFWKRGLAGTSWQGRNSGLCGARRGSDGAGHTLFQLSNGKIRGTVLPATRCPLHISVWATSQDCWLAEVFSCSNSYIYIYGPFHPSGTRIGQSKILIPVLERRKLRLREMKWFIQTHTVGKVQSQGWLSSVLPLPPLFCTIGLTAS